MTGLSTLLRELTPQVLAAVVRRYRDFSAAEDAVQEALTAAALQWPEKGQPDNPRAWLIQVASRKLTDQLRAELARKRREAIVFMQAETEAAPLEVMGEAKDDTLLLLFMCCHPALTRPTAIALTLRAVAGLTTSEIAHAFLVPEPTMAQRISRAKQSIMKSEIGFEMPSEAERAERLVSVLHVIYLVFNEGYMTSSGDSVHRVDLSSEAIRLARAVHALLPNDPEVAGLLALMILTDARRPARTGPHGELIPLDEQDRSLWDRRAIEEGVALVTAAMRRGAIGTYQVQAAIAALHGEARRAEDTDWPQIDALYGVLERMGENPIISLNRAVAAAMVHGPERGLELLVSLDSDPRIAETHRLDAVRGHLYERAGDPERAIAHFRAAARKTANTPERSYLLMKAARLASGAKD